MNAKRLAELKRTTGAIAASKYVRGRMFGKVECAELEAILSDYEAALPLLEAVKKADNADGGGFCAYTGRKILDLADRYRYVSRPKSTEPPERSQPNE